MQAQGLSLRSSIHTALHAPLHNPHWQVRLLGGLHAAAGERVLQHLPSRAIAQLLARLASAPGRAHPREELIELLWPGVELDVGRNRLRQALSTLKRLLEGDAPDAPAVLRADRISVQVVPGALCSDVQQFEGCLRSGDGAGAFDAYGGEFMPGHYEEWVLEERTRLAAQFERLTDKHPTAPLPVAYGARGAHGARGTHAARAPRANWCWPWLHSLSNGLLPSCVPEPQAYFLALGSAAASTFCTSAVVMSKGAQRSASALAA
jgi:hypothetical protein